MKQHFNRIFSALLAVVLCVGLLTVAVSVSAAEASGTCGDDLTWSLQNGVLTIAGTGAMDDYREHYQAPWTDYADRIQRIVVSSGVTAIGRRAFYGLSALTTATLPSSVTKLSALAFAECSALTQITLSGVEEIGWACFYNCLSLSNVTLPDCLRIVGEEAFYHCSSLSGITVPRGVEQLGAMAFTYCSSLVYVRIEAPIDVLSNWVFYGCDLLWELYLPSTIETVEKNALGECPSLYYVDFGGSQEVKEEIEYQLAQETTREPNTSTTAEVVFVDYGDVKITTTTTFQTGSSDIPGNIETGTVVSATVTDPAGWEEVADYIESNDFHGGEPKITVEVQDDLSIPQGALEDLEKENVIVTIHTSDNVDWTIVIPHQDETSLSGAQDLSVTLKQNTSDKYADTIGDAKSYIVTMGDTTLKSTVLIPLGNDTARRTATLYLVDGNELKKLASVVVDDDGKAAFPLAGTEAGDYVVALDVQDIPQEEVRIPNKLAAEYGIEYTYGATLTDAYGNQYVLTGRVNKLGFGIGELTLIIVGVLVASIVVVGAVMFMWNKQQKRIYANAAREK